MAVRTARTKTTRDRAYTALVGNVRAFRQQLEAVGGELVQEQNPADVVVLRLLAELAPKLVILDELGTAKLRETA